MSDLKLVDMRSYRTLEEGTPEYEEWKHLLTPTAEPVRARPKLTWDRELSLGAESAHIERRTERLVEREREGAELVEIRALGDWHAGQARLHEEAAGWCRGKVHTIRGSVRRRRRLP
jgi:hypothetical protein